mgnify:CR=1 FL=1
MQVKTKVDLQPYVKIWHDVVPYSLKHDSDYKSLFDNTPLNDNNYKALIDNT